jgi:hypothetical protein
MECEGALLDRDQDAPPWPELLQDRVHEPPKRRPPHECRRLPRAPNARAAASTLPPTQIWPLPRPERRPPPECRSQCAASKAPQREGRSRRLAYRSELATTLVHTWSLVKPSALFNTVSRWGNPFKLHGRRNKTYAFSWVDLKYASKRFPRTCSVAEIDRIIPYQSNNRSACS